MDYGVGFWRKQARTCIWTTNSGKVTGDLRLLHEAPATFSAIDRRPCLLFRLLFVTAGMAWIHRDPDMIYEMRFSRHTSTRFLLLEWLRLLQYTQGRSAGRHPPNVRRWRSTLSPECRQLLYACPVISTWAECGAARAIDCRRTDRARRALRALAKGWHRNA